MKKKGGFTLVELIITIAITTIILGILSTFFIGNIKAFKKSEISSNLQLEAGALENELLTIGTQSSGIINVNGVDISKTKKMYYKDILKEDGSLEIKNIKFEVDNIYYEITFSKYTNILSVKKTNKSGSEIKEDGYPKDLATNVSEFNIRPLDFRMNKNGSLYDAYAIEINMKLKDNSWNKEVEISSSLIVKFRNKGY